MQYYEERNEDAESFAERTRYYFKDTTYGLKKQEQYAKFGTEDNPELTAYARRYGNHWARKRIKSANKAARHFRDMTARTQRYAHDDHDSTWDRFSHRKEIMSYRLNGMLEAAEMKSKSKTHERYLKGKARLSCNMILKEQLKSLLEEEQDPRLKRKLQSELESVQSKIISAKKDVRDSIKNVQETWRDKNDINSTTRRAKKQEYRQRCGEFSDTGTELLFNFEKLRSQSLNAVWPSCVVLKDSHGAPINRAELKRQQFNQSYQNALQSGDQNAIKEHEQKAIRRFMRIRLPEPKELVDTKFTKDLLANLRDYYEVTKLALPYLRKQLVEGGTAKEFADAHPEFAKNSIMLKL